MERRKCPIGRSALQGDSRATFAVPARAPITGFHGYSAEGGAVGGGCSGWG